MTAKKQVVANDEKITSELEKANAKIEALELALSESKSKEKIVKEFSDFFCDKDNEQMKYKNLSETKRYFEINHSDILKKMCEKLKVSFLTSKMFHSELTILVS